MGAESLAQRINQPVARARELLRLHKETYRIFWAWSDAAVDHAMLHGKLWTTFGWTIHTGTSPNPRFLRNFLMQANGAEMLRLACINLTKSGIKVCAPVHDAVLIEAPLDFLTEIIRQTQQIMSDASAIVLDGFRLRSDAEVFRSAVDPAGCHLAEDVFLVFFLFPRQHGEQALAVQAWIGPCAGGFDEGWEDVDVFDHGVGDDARFDFAGPSGDECRL